MTNSPEQSELAVPPENIQNKPSRIQRWLGYGALPATVALTLFTSACEKDSKKISGEISPTGVDEALKTRAIPTDETSPTTSNYSATKTYEPAKTPTEKAPTATPTPRAEILVDPQITDNISRSGRTLEETRNTIKEIVDISPLFAPIQAIIVPGTKDNSEAAQARLFVGRDHVDKNTEKYEVAAQVAHILDVESNNDYFKKHFTPEQIDKLLQLRQDALADPIWGRDYPSVEKVIKGKTGVQTIPTAGATTEQIAAASDISANLAWIGGREPLTNAPLNPYEDDMKPAQDYIDNLKPGNPAELTTSYNFHAFRHKQIDAFFNSCPLVKVAEKQWRKQRNESMFEEKNVNWTTQLGSQSSLLGVTEKEWWQVLFKETELVLLEKYVMGELDATIAAFPPEKQAAIERVYKQRLRSADHEKFARLYSDTLLSGEKTSLTPYLDMLKEFNRANKATSSHQPLSPGAQLRYDNFNIATGLVDTDPYYPKP